MSAGFTRLGRYLPEALLGQSSATETYRARALEPLPAALAQDFILKVLRQEYDHGESASRFIAAVRVLQWTSLPGTAKVVEIGEPPGPIFARRSTG